MLDDPRFETATSVIGAQLPPLLSLSAEFDGAFSLKNLSSANLKVVGLGIGTLPFKKPAPAK